MRIPSTSELIIGQRNTGIRLKALGISVEGKLTAGSTDCPIETKIRIILLGNRPSDAVTNRPEAIVKGISVTGTLNLHGEQFYRTWTRLANTIHAGDNYAFLQDKVNWKRGQKVVVVTTAVSDTTMWHQNEVLKVECVNNFRYNKQNKGSIVYFKSSFQHDHVLQTGVIRECPKIKETKCLQHTIRIIHLLMLN